MISQMLVVTLVFLACVGVGLGLMALLLVRNEHAARQGRMASERDLYESGREAARQREAKPQAETSNSALACRLRAAGVQMAPRRWFVLVVVFALAAFTIALLVSGQVLGGLVAVACVAIGIRVLLDRRQRQRREQFDTQFARALPQISASVRGSLTLERALRVATAHLDEPLRGEFSRVLADAAYGMPLHQALEAMAVRTQHADVKTLAAATRMRQRRGGSIAASLDMISTHVNARLKASRELKTEIASAKMAKWFVAAAMPVIFLIMYASNADFAHFYATEPLGWCALGAAALLEVVGLLVAHRITSLDC